MLAHQAQFRSKVQKESNTGSVDTQRVRTTLCIAVLHVEFDTEVCTLRIKGRNMEENPYVKVSRGTTCMYTYTYTHATHMHTHALTHTHTLTHC